MHPNMTIGSELVSCYEFFSDITWYIVIAAVFVYSLACKKLDSKWLLLGYEKTEKLREKGGFYKIFSKPFWIFLNAALYFGVYAIIGVTNGLFSFLSDPRYFTKLNYFTDLYFGLIPVVLLTLVCGLDVRKTIDTITPFHALEIALGKISCFCAGCCYGIPWQKGTYNFNTHRIEFPVQLLEMCVGIVISAVLFYLLHRKKTDGKIYPIYMILYSATRFLTEFLRDDFPSNWLGMKPFQVLCLIGIVVGAVWLVLIKVLQKKNKRFLENTDLVSFCIEKIKKGRSKDSPSCK